MGLGPPVIDLYRQLKLHGALEGVANVMELGSQDFWCPQKNHRAQEKAREVADLQARNAEIAKQLEASAQETAIWTQERLL
jgi:hypothetical protein